MKNTPGKSDVPRRSGQRLSLTLCSDEEQFANAVESQRLDVLVRLPLVVADSQEVRKGSVRLLSRQGAALKAGRQVEIVGASELRYLTQTLLVCWMPHSTNHNNIIEEEECDGALLVL